MTHFSFVLLTMLKSTSSFTSWYREGNVTRLHFLNLPCALAKSFQQKIRHGILLQCIKPNLQETQVV